MEQEKCSKLQGSSKRQKGKTAFISFQEETGEGCFELKFIVGEQKFEVVAVSHLVQVGVSALLLSQGGSFSLKSR